MKSPVAKDFRRALLHKFLEYFNQRPAVKHQCPLQLPSAVLATPAAWMVAIPAAAKCVDHRMLAQELDASSGWVIIKDKTVDSAALFHDLYNDMENLAPSAGPSNTSRYSSVPSTPPSYSSGPSTPQIYSPGSSRNAECSNCKQLRGRISVLKATMEMHMHPEQHTLNSAALLHEVLNEMEKLDLE
ncbi:hypothetical protein Tco_0942808 [Tanacetum coccineum]